jgi:predicted nucleotidyltransferase
MTSINLSHKEERALQAYVRALDERFGERLLEVLLFGSKVRTRHARTLTSMSQSSWIDPALRI